MLDFDKKLEACAGMTASRIVDWAVKTEPEISRLAEEEFRQEDHEKKFVSHLLPFLARHTDLWDNTGALRELLVKAAINQNVFEFWTRMVVACRISKPR